MLINVVIQKVNEKSLDLWGGQNGRVIVYCVCEVTGRSSVRLLMEVEGNCIALQQ